MKTLIAPLLMLLFLTGCKGGGDSAVAQVDASPNAPAPTPTPVPIDYSTVACSSVAECAEACQLLAPHTDNTTIDSDVCGTIPLFQGAPCNAIKTMNNSLVADNQTCKLDFVTNIITVNSIGSGTCSDDAGCAIRCNTLFQPQTRTQVLNQHGISGASLVKVFENQIIIEELEACLSAPFYFVENEY